MRKKRLLVIGAGFGQVPAIKKAKELNIEVITVDKNPNAEGFQYADKAYPIDILDGDSILKVSKEFGIDGAMTMQTDLPIPTLGYINDKLGLVGVTYSAAKNCSNKILTRKKLQSKGVSQPNFEVVASLEATIKAVNEIGLPAIVKAVDSSGSRGVTKVTSSTQIKQAFYEAKKYNRQPEILVEEFIDGVELGAQAFSVKGKCEAVFLHNDTLADGKYLVPTGHSFPSHLPESHIKEAERVIKACVEALEINDGPSNIDIIISHSGEVKIIEVGARIGATCLPELVSYYSGIDWVKETILNALGESVNLNKSGTHPCAALILEAPKDGKLMSFNIPEEVKTNPNCLEVEVSAKEGDDVSVLRKGTDRIGKIVVKEESATLAEELVYQLRKRITFNIV
ncbi:ATP-grasp domain-containing protein [Persicobacter sp. CCB-QB2]|uniref:ATP-grasp domain-containing protein n=1 Tax=Persicobacter sp. CCB-QB2 TaxID=1561025 RepID=UPI0006A95B96|nr:ATP-grasp domain-containing protein [Persicobacter sp. CCB-QB2]